MALFPEREKAPSEVIERPEDISPLTIERKEVVRPTQSQFTAKVTDDKGQPLVQSPATQKVSIQLPTDQVQLTTWSKGPVSSSLTWLAAFWLRLIKKAFHFGWQIVSGGQNAGPRS